MENEIIETLIKVDSFIQDYKNINYKVRLLEIEVPNLTALVEKLVNKTSVETVTITLDEYKRLSKLEENISIRLNVATFEKLQQDNNLYRSSGYSSHPDDCFIEGAKQMYEILIKELIKNK